MRSAQEIGRRKCREGSNAGGYKSSGRQLVLSDSICVEVRSGGKSARQYAHALSENCIAKSRKRASNALALHCVCAYDAVIDSMALARCRCLLHLPRNCFHNISVK